MGATELPEMDLDGYTEQHPPPAPVDEEAELDRIAARELEGEAQVPRRWRRAPELVDEILARANEPWVPLEIPGGEVARVRAGGTAVLMAPTGTGKTSLSGQIGAVHARERGPVAILSCELPADEAAARICGMQTDASWEDVLRGRVPRADMERVLALPRLVIIERQAATLDALDQALGVLSREFPGEPMLAVVDYVQIVPGEKDEIRHRVSDTMTRIDDIARTHRAVVIAVSQMSRATSRAARAGEALGAETTDGGAETAAIERYASITITLGGAQPPDERGEMRVNLSLGKYRMGGGDRVIPMRFEGRTGRWRVDGEARLASEVREEAQAARDDAKTRQAALAIVAAASRAEEPLSRNELRVRAGVGQSAARAGIARAMEEGELVEVKKRRPRARAWMLWTRERASEAGIPVAAEEASP